MANVSRQLHFFDKLRGVLAVLLLANLVIVCLVFQAHLGAMLSSWSRGVIEQFQAGKSTAVDSQSGDEDHDHAVSQRLPLSEQARKNLGLTGEFVAPLQLTTFYRTLNVPGMVVELPGRTRLKMTTPLTGMILEVLVTSGQTVVPGTPLFRVRLTHEDLVQTQKQFLQALGERDVEIREIERLSSLSESGAVAGRVLLERQYAREKLEAQLQAQREALRLHGLSPRQIESVETDRRLLQELEIVALAPREHQHEELHLSDGPGKPLSAAVRPASWQQTTPTTESAARNLEQSTEHAADHPPELIVLNLQVSQGQAVQAGEMLCELADFSQLFIEGKAFEKDAAAISQAELAGWKLSATLETPTGYEQLHDLQLSHVNNVIDATTHILPFYVALPNRLLRDQVNERGERFITWKYRVGQRMQLHIPREALVDQFVVPAVAVARDGVDFVVFRENGSVFEPVSVHVVYRDHRTAVLANDGSLFPGDVVALKGAHQMWLALKSLNGPEIDPHAGHNH